MRGVIAAARELVAEGCGDVGDEEEWISAAERRLATIAEDEVLAADRVTHAGLEPAWVAGKATVLDR